MESFEVQSSASCTLVDGEAGSGSRRTLRTILRHRLTPGESSLNILDEYVPTIAVLVDPSLQDDQKMEDSYVQVLAEATLMFHGAPRRLLVCSLKPVQSAFSGQTPKTPVEKMMVLQQHLERATRDSLPAEGPQMWPLQETTTRGRLASMSAMETGEVVPCWLRFLNWLHLRFPQGGEMILRILQDMYGSTTAYSLAWDDFYVQKLWVLAFVGGLGIVLQANPNKDGYPRWCWEIFKCVVLLWGLWVTFRSRYRQYILSSAHLDGSQSAPQVHIGDHLEGKRSDGKWYAATVQSDKEDGTFWLAWDDSYQDERRKPKTEMRVRLHNKNFRPSNRTAAYRLRVRCFELLLVTLFCAFVIIVSGLIVQLEMWLTFVWADCLHLECTTADKGELFSLGFVYECLADIALGVVFVIVPPLAGCMGNFISKMRNYQWSQDSKHTALMYAIAGEGVGKVGFLVILAFVFVPQWVEYSGKEADCSDLWSVPLFGHGSLQCLQRRLTADQRQRQFTRLMTGPFVVAPFIAILLKFIVARIVDRLNVWARDYHQPCCDACCDGLVRILALIFVYDGDSVGGLKFVTKGWPFSHVQPVSAEALSERKLEERKQLIDQALEQAVLRPFDPFDELLELKLSFLWALFFVPVKPFGIFPTLVARLLESHTDVMKLLYVCRLSFPYSSQDSYLAHSTQKDFVFIAFILAIFWSIGLSLITYNGNLWKWFT